MTHPEWLAGIREREAKGRMIHMEEVTKILANVDELSANTEADKRIIAEMENKLWLQTEKIIKLEKKLGIAEEALEYIACEGMDDGDFYAEEFVAEGTIAMANRARSALAQIRGKS